MSLKAASVLYSEGRTDRWSPHIYLFGKPEDMSQPETFGKLRLAAKRHGIRQLYAPNPSKSNAYIADKSEFAWVASASLPLYNGVEADGVILDRHGDGAVILSADCPTIIAWNSAADPKKRKVIVAHGGRDSLLDKSIFLGYSKSRLRHSSVVDAVLELFETSERRTLIVYAVLGISARHFTHPADHPEHAKQNQAMIEYVCRRFGKGCFVGNVDDGALDLQILIRKQFEKGGVPGSNVRFDKNETYAGKKQLAGKQLQWHSHRRAGKNGRSGRNAVLVLHSLGPKK